MSYIRGPPLFKTLDFLQVRKLTPKHLCEWKHSNEVFIATCNPANVTLSIILLWHLSLRLEISFELQMQKIPLTPKYLAHKLFSWPNYSTFCLSTEILLQDLFITCIITNIGIRIILNKIRKSKVSKVNAKNIKSSPFVIDNNIIKHTWFSKDGMV